MAKFCTNARISNKFIRLHLLTKFASYKVPPVMVSSHGSLVSTLLYPRLSVDRRLRLGTGWEPPIRGSEMFERPPRPNLTDFFQFFCKKHMSHPFPWWNFFCGVQKFFLPPQMGHFLGAPTLSQNWGALPKIEGPGCERTPFVYQFVCFRIDLTPSNN